MIGHLTSTEVLNVDETGIHINGVTSWLHVLANSKSTLYFAHEKRGKEAMDEVGILKNYKVFYAMTIENPIWGLPANIRFAMPII